MTVIETIAMIAYCGHFLDDGTFHFYGAHDPECGFDAPIELDRQDWLDGCASADCPSCGAKLEQGNDHFYMLA